MGPEKTSGQLIKSWSDQEIQSFPEEWDTSGDEEQESCTVKKQQAQGHKEELLTMPTDAICRTYTVQLRGQPEVKERPLALS